MMLVEGGREGRRGGVWEEEDWWEGRREGGMEGAEGRGREKKKNELNRR